MIVNGMNWSSPEWCKGLFDSTGCIWYIILLQSLDKQIPSENTCLTGISLARNMLNKFKRIKKTCQIDKCELVYLSNRKLTCRGNVSMHIFKPLRNSIEIGHRDLVSLLSFILRSREAVKCCGWVCVLISDFVDRIWKSCFVFIVLHDNGF